LLEGPSIDGYHDWMKRRNSPPRVGIFSKQLDNWTSGSGHHLNEILTSALDLNNGRFDFTFIHYRPSDNRIYTRVRELIVPRNPLRAAIALRRQDFDIVHYTPLTIYAPIWGIRSKKVATIHGAEQFHVPQFYGAVELAHERLIGPPYARHMDRIVTVSETTADFIAGRFRVPRENIVVCYNGLSPLYHVLPKDEVTAPGRYGVALPYILHVSRFSARKNPWTLLDAFARFVHTHGAPHSLVCAGGGWGDEPVVKRAKALGIFDRLVTPGFVPERDIAELMNAAAAFVYPSLAEGFGMPNVEAMGCGCPVITTPGFAIREIVGDAACIVEDPYDAAGLSEAMYNVITDAQLRGRLIARGMARVPLFSWAQSAERLLSVYEDLSRA
jgi:glycosyltransferase involved in cell wall biosynthesis